MSPGYWSALRNFGRKRWRERGKSSLSSSSRRLVSTDSGSIACFGKRGSKATSSILPRSRHHVGGGDAYRGLRGFLQRTEVIMEEVVSSPPARPSPSTERSRRYRQRRRRGTRCITVDVRRILVVGAHAVL